MYEDEVPLDILSGANEEVFTYSLQRKATLQNVIIKLIIVMAQDFHVVFLFFYQVYFQTHKKCTCLCSLLVYNESHIPPIHSSHKSINSTTLPVGAINDIQSRLLAGHNGLV